MVDDCNKDSVSFTWCEVRFFDRCDIPAVIHLSLKIEIERVDKRAEQRQGPSVSKNASMRVGVRVGG